MQYEASAPPLMPHLESRGIWASICAAVLGVLTLAGVTRTLIHHQPVYDELVHILAARGVLRTGEPVIADGIYDRAELFTRLVAVSMRLLGDSLVAARIPGLIAGFALVALVGGWVTRKAGFLAGACACVLLAIFPLTSELSVFCRFYTLHALAIAVALIALFETQESSGHRAAKVLLALCALGAGLLAWHLQPTTAIAIGAGVGGLAVSFALGHWIKLRAFVTRRPVLCLAACLAVAIAGVGTLQYAGLFAMLHTAPPWAKAGAERSTYYLVALARGMPLLWPLVPLALLGTFARHRQIAGLCFGFVVVGLVAHSIAAQKASRYVYYLLPFVSVLLGCGMAAGVSAIANLIRHQVSCSFSSDGVPHACPMRVDRGAGIWCLIAALTIAVATVGLSSEGQRALRLLTATADSQSMLSFADEADWTRAIPVLRPLIAGGATVITSNTMKAIYYLGFYDYALNANDVSEAESQSEFGRDSRTGRLAISKGQSLERVLKNALRAVVVVEAKRLGTSGGVPQDVVQVVRSLCNTVPVPPESGIAVWTCDGR